MTPKERSLIEDLDKCDFGEINTMHKAKVEARKNMTKEEKKVSSIFVSSIIFVLVFEHGPCAFFKPDLYF